MKKIARFLLLSLLLATALPCFSACSETRGLEFVLLDDGTYGVRAKSTYHRQELVIPASYEGVAVTAILANGFAGSEAIETVSLPSSLRTVGAGAFLDCAALTEITLPSGLTAIGAGAFMGCPSLDLTEHGGALYLASETTPFFYLYKATSTAITEVALHEETVFIADIAFAHCRALTALHLPASLRAIGADAFFDCTALATVTAADPATFAGIAFANRAANPAAGAGGLSADGALLTEITLAEGLTAIGDYAFAGFTALTEITLPEGLVTIGAGAFYGCAGLTAVSTPAAVNRIGIDAFFACASLTEVTLGSIEGWHHGGFDIPSAYLTDPATIAAYLTGTYHSYLWSRY